MVCLLMSSSENEVLKRVFDYRTNVFNTIKEIETMIKRTNFSPELKLVSPFVDLSMSFKEKFSFLDELVLGMTKLGLPDISH